MPAARESQSIFLPALFLLIFILVWQLASRIFQINPLILPSPASIMQSAREHAGDLAGAAWRSGCLALAGFAAHTLSVYKVLHQPGGLNLSLFSAGSLIAWLVTGGSATLR